MSKSLKTGVTSGSATVTPGLTRGLLVSLLPEMTNGFRVKPGMTASVTGKAASVAGKTTSVARRTMLVMAALLSGACDTQEQSAVEMPPLTVLVAQSTIKDVPLFMEMVGTTTGTQDVPIRTRVEGYLETMEFEEGTFVNKGDTLYTIDDQPFQAKVVAAQSELAAACVL